MMRRPIAGIPPLVDLLVLILCFTAALAAAAYGQTSSPTSTLPAPAVQTSQSTPINTYVDLGAGPQRVQVTQGSASICQSDAQPAALDRCFIASSSDLVPPAPFQTTAHIWARALTSSLTTVVHSPITATGGSGGSSTFSGTVNATPSNLSPGAWHSVPVTQSTTHVFDASTSGRTYLDLKNNSKTETISCDLNGSGAPVLGMTFDIAPGFDKIWEGSATPSGAIDCVSSNIATPTATLYAGQGLK